MQHRARGNFRIRSIKPEFWQDARVRRWPDSVRLLFIGLWTWADDSGRFPWDVGGIAAFLWPGELEVDPASVIEKTTEGLQLLLEQGRINAYENGAKNSAERYGIIVNWFRHQRVINPSAPRCPEPPRGLQAPFLTPQPEAINAPPVPDKSEKSSEIPRKRRGRPRKSDAEKAATLKARKARNRNGSAPLPDKDAPKYDLKSAPPRIIDNSGPERSSRRRNGGPDLKDRAEIPVDGGAFNYPTPKGENPSSGFQPVPVTPSLNRSETQELGSRIYETKTPLPPKRGEEEPPQAEAGEGTAPPAVLERRINRLRHYTAMGLRQALAGRFPDYGWNTGPTWRWLNRLSERYSIREWVDALSDERCAEIDSPRGMEYLLKRRASEAPKKLPGREAPKRRLRALQTATAKEGFHDDPESVIQTIEDLRAAGERVPHNVKAMMRGVFERAGREIPDELR